MRRRFLFLQGVCSPFFPCLADRLAQEHAEIYRINFNMGDAAYWSGRPCWKFREDISALEDFLSQKFAAHQFTDVVLFGDRRPVHLPVPALAEKHHARVHVFEEGYFRPNWITLERGGVNRNSSLPRDPLWYLTKAKNLPAPELTKVSSPLWIRGMHDALYHLANLANPFLYPGYRTHRPHIAGLEYAGWAKRFPRLPLHGKKDARTITDLLKNNSAYFILPLQLNSDAQIIENSSFRNMTEVIDAAVHSFAHHASETAHLIIKNHPLDTGFTDYQKHTDRLCKKLNLEGRLHYMETGNLNLLLPHAKGVVTVNSTLATQALEMGCPVKTLADPIYNFPGLTAQESLDDFWTNPVTPDKNLFDAFRRVVMHTVMVNGGFYNQVSIKLAVENSMRLIMPLRSPLDELLL